MFVKRIFGVGSILTCFLFLALSGYAQDVTNERWTVVTDTLTMDELLDVAVKFFSIEAKPNSAYTYGAGLCVANAAHTITQPGRDKKLGSFCAGAIFEHADDGVYDLHNELINVVKEISQLNLGLNDDERQLRAEGALYVLMKQNRKLREALWLEYEQQRHMLHFYIIPEG